MKDQNPFKEKLHNYTLPVRDDIWKNVEANLPVKRRRLPFLWLSLAGFLLIGASSISLSLLHKPIIPAATPENKSIEEIQNTNPTNVENTIVSEAPKQSLKESSVVQEAKASASGKNQYGKTRAKLFTDKVVGKNSISSNLALTDYAVTGNTSFSKEVNVIDGIQTLDITLLDKKVISNKISKIKPDPSCYKFRGKNGKKLLSVDVFGTPGFAPRSFESAEGGTSPYATARNQTEKSQYAFGAGARVNLNLEQGFAVRLGVMYEQIGDIFNYTDPAATQQHMVIDSFFAADGTFLYSQATTVTILGTLIKKIHNRYTHLDIPLVLSYELPMGRSTLMVNAGPVLNLTSAVRGQILDVSLNPVHITPGEPDELKAYKNNLGLSIYIGAGALFPLTDNISALVEPRLLYRINPVTLDTYPLKEHRSFAGLNLGIRYHFN
ncbi:MAG: hypothetical protein IPP15_01630 [Saprospiraceae bacterium]|uniref:Outer membrane protein beta-barrel domain-containing protein n=1 Tax=Candidatus Opimibacter skivensis TaxID=2982028 RepID=A0A9D7SQB5_9BACT|nr:hypothetical protein [Candidatus Opimibacter skivensis]